MSTKGRVINITPPFYYFVDKLLVVVHQRDGESNYQGREKSWN